MTLSRRGAETHCQLQQIIARTRWRRRRLRPGVKDGSPTPSVASPRCTASSYRPAKAAAIANGAQVFQKCGSRVRKQRWCNRLEKALGAQGRNRIVSYRIEITSFFKWWCTH